MSRIAAIFLFAMGASAYVEDYTLDKMINRAKSDEDLERALDDSVLAKGGDGAAAPAPAPKGGAKAGTYQNTAYKNGQMGRDRIWKGYEEAGDIAKKTGLDFDPFGWFRAASPKLVDPELALGEAGTFGEKQKWYDEDGTPKPSGGAKAVPVSAPVLQPIPYVQRGFTPYASMKMPNTVRGRVQAAQFRAPFLAATDTVSIFGLAMIGLFAGSALAFVLFHLRHRRSVVLTQ